MTISALNMQEKLIHNAAINSLIPKALKEAARKVKKSGKVFERRPATNGLEYIHYFEAQYYHRAMNRMAKKEGIRC